MQECTLFSFSSTRQALKAERVLKEAGLPARLLPMPREISLECGLVLEVDGAEEDRVLEALKEARPQKKIRVVRERGKIVEVKEVTEVRAEE